MHPTNNHWCAPKSCRPSTRVTGYLPFCIRLEALLQLAELIDTRIVTGLLQAAEFHLRAGAAQGGDGLIELAHQRQAFRACRQLLIAQPQRGFRLRQQIPAVEIVMVGKGVAVQDAAAFPPAGRLRGRRSPG